MNVINWFEIPVTDMDRAKTFYEAVLDLELKLIDLGDIKMAWFPSMDQTNDEAAGTLMQADEYIPSHEGTMVYFSVADIEATLGRAVVNGGKVLHPKKGIGEFGFVGHFEDTEGNRVALHSRT